MSKWVQINERNLESIREDLRLAKNNPLAFLFFDADLHSLRSVEIIYKITGISHPDIGEIYIESYDFSNLQFKGKISIDELISDKWWIELVD